MKKLNTLLLLFLLPLWGLGGFAQEKLTKEEKARREKNIQAGNPFARFGYKAKIATLSKGKYLEFHDLDSIVIIGTVRWHVNKNQIVGRIVLDSLNPDAQPIGDRAGRWISPDPLSEEFPSWSPYNMCMDNPLRMVDPDGRESKDIIKFMNNGAIERTATNDKFDILTNEKGDISKTIAHDVNGSQIGKIENARGIDYMLIKDDKVARDVFEFAASTTANKTSNAEFGLDVFKFPDGFSMNLFATGEKNAKGLANVKPMGQLGEIDLGNNHLISNSIWEEGNHSHPEKGPLDPLVPSGFDIRGGLFSPNPTNIGDRAFMTGEDSKCNINRTPINAYLYGGYSKSYIKYDAQSAKKIGDRK